MFNFLKNTLHKIYSGFTARIAQLFNRSEVDSEMLQELEKILIASDTGVATTRYIIEEVKKAHQAGELSDGAHLKTTLATTLRTLLDQAPHHTLGNVILLVGINGSGKTTCAGKLAHHFIKQGKRVLFVAADTFRAAAAEQLSEWAHLTNATILKGNPQQDPASVVFAGCEMFQKQNFDIMIIDTAGRLQTKTNLMQELTKIKRVIVKQLPSESISTLLVIDGMLGQNSLEQAKLFKESTDVSGIIMTKMDSTAKGGIMFAIAHTLSIPVLFISFGEQKEQLKQFDKAEYVDNLLTQ